MYTYNMRPREGFGLLVTSFIASSFHVRLSFTSQPNNLTSTTKEKMHCGNGRDVVDVTPLSITTRFVGIAL